MGLQGWGGGGGEGRGVLRDEGRRVRLLTGAPETSAGADGEAVAVVILC